MNNPNEEANEGTYSWKITDVKGVFKYSGRDREILVAGEVITVKDGDEIRIFDEDGHATTPLRGWGECNTLI